MEMLDRNLDAYRIVAEILATLRNAVHKRLAKRHGDDWYRTGLPDGVLTRLIERKEKEKTIDWYDSEYQQLIDFATFTEILEILATEPDLVPGISKLAPNLPLLHARLLELDVLREKLALARPISENELSFLGTFYLRFRKAAEEEERRDDEAAAAAAADDEDEDDGEAAKDSKKKKAKPARPPVEAAAEEAAEAKAEKASTDTERPKPKPVKPVVPPPDVAAAQAAKEEAASRQDGGDDEAAGPQDGGDDEAAGPQDGGDDEAAGPQDGGDDEAAEESVEDQVAALAAAVEAGDDTAILRGLYREVIEIAEGLWTTEVPPEPEAWESVRSSDWYARNFSSLSLQPLSDFYQVVEAVREMMEDGLARDRLQEFLKEHNFAAVLLSLRDMFQKHEI